MKTLVLCFLLLIAFNVTAQQNLRKFSRIAVFPIKVDNRLSEEAESAWFEIRKTLSENKRFMVASKNFLETKDVYQARSELKPADVLILGRLLDAELIITTFHDQQSRNLVMIANETEDGRVLWRGKIRLQSSLPIKQQLGLMSMKLIKDFIDKVPYHGYALKDNLKRNVVYKSGRRYIVQVKAGDNPNIKKGDSVHFVEVSNSQYGDFFSPSMNTKIVAEGTVYETDGNVAYVDLNRVKSAKAIKEFQLVVFPGLISDNQKNLYGYQYLDSLGLTKDQLEENKWKKFDEEKKPLITSLAYFFNIAAMVLLAF